MRLPISALAPLTRLTLVLAALCLPLLAAAQGVATPFDYARSSSFTYYGPDDGALNGLLKSETLEPGSPNECLLTSYTYDTWGNKASATTANCIGASGEAIFTSRASSQTWTRATLPKVTIDGRELTLQAGQFPLDAKNALLQATAQLFDPRFGTPTQFTDLNGLLTTAEYDELGRKTKETKPDWTNLHWRHCVIPGKGLDTSTDSPGCVAPPEAPDDAVFYVQSWPTDINGTVSGPWAMVFSDRAGRQIRSVTQSFDGPSQPDQQRGTSIVQDDVYNAFGTKVLSSQPYWVGTGSSMTTGANDAGATKTVVDALGRPTQIFTVDPMATRTGIVFGASPFAGYGAYGARTARLVELSYAGGKTTTTTYYRAVVDGPELSRIRIEEKNAVGEVVRITDNTGAQLVQQADAFGLLRYTRDALGNTVFVTSDVRGRKVKLNDTDTGVMEYGYNALGELVWQRNTKQRTKVPATRTEMSYDVLGRLTQRIDDEYTSTWTYDKDAGGASCRISGTSLGHLCAADTSHGVHRRYWFDKLGRPTSDRLDVDGGISAAQRYEWNATNSRLAKRTWPTGLAVSYDYTSLGRVSQLRLVQQATIDPLPTNAGGGGAPPVDWGANRVIWRAEIVNAWGRSERHSTGAATDTTTITTRSIYNAPNGRLTSRMAGLNEGVGVFSHGYTYDGLGRMVTRTDRNGTGDGDDLGETFTYDSLDRLVNYTAAHPAIPGEREVKLTYNAMGMLLKRSDVGSYSYTVVAGQTSPQPHSIKKFTDLAGQATQYNYDGNGNVIRTLVNDTTCATKYCWATYTSFNQPDDSLGIRGPKIGSVPPNPKYTWQYDQDHARIKETRLIWGTEPNAGTRTTWRIHPDNAGGLGFEYEEDVPKVASPEYPLVQQSRHYIGVGGQAVAVFVSQGVLQPLADGAKTPPAATSLTLVKVEYWHTDSLGNVVTTTNHNGAVTARYSYDPFGQRRFTSGLDDPEQSLEIDWNPAVNHDTGNGFTGHEHLDDVGLVHMNGRMYDPRLGLFLQPDPALQDPFNLQNYHRYGYCLGGPLTCTDPSGYNWLSDRWHALWHSKVFRTVGAIAAAYFLGPGGYGLFTIETAGAYAGIANAAVAGFASGAISSGNIKGAMQGAFSGAVFYGAGNLTEGGDFFTGGGKESIGIMGGVAVHGVAGCVTSVAGGGKCGQGALSAAFSKYANMSGSIPKDRLGGLIASAVVGGTASVLGGGKFENGATTAAYGYLFNELMHSGHGRTAYRRNREYGDTSGWWAEANGWIDSDGNQIPPDYARIREDVGSGSAVASPLLAIGGAICIAAEPCGAVVAGGLFAASATAGVAGNVLQRTPGGGFIDFAIDNVVDLVGSRFGLSKLGVVLTQEIVKNDPAVDAAKKAADKQLLGK